MRVFDEMTKIQHPSGLMKPKPFFCLVLICVSALVAGAQTSTPPQPAEPAIPPLPVSPPPPVTTRKTRSLTLEECIRLALEHNLDIQIQRYNPIINGYAISVNYGVYEPLFNFTGTKSYNDRPATPGAINPATGLPFPSSIGESDYYQPEVKGILPTGLSYDLTGPITRNSSLTYGPPPYYLPPIWNTGPGITLSQPLLKNFWIDNNRLQILLSKATLKISEAALRLQIMTSVTAVKSAYYNLLYTRGNVEANATAYKLAEQLVNENLTRVKVGALAPLDEKQSESQAAASLAAMQAAEQAQAVQEHTLENLLTDNYSEWADTTLLPAEQLVAVPEELNLQESWRRAVTQRPDIVEAKLRAEQQNITLKYDFNQIFPSLNILGSYGRNANDTTFNNVLGDIQTGNHSFYSYGVQMSIPLGGNYTGRNQYKSDKTTLKQLLLTLKQTEQNIVVAVDNDVGSVRSSLQQVYATRDARVYAEDALQAERTKLENGKSTSFIVLQLISSLTTAKVNEVQALANYNIAVSQLALDEGSTLEANHIDLKVK
jgi:HAE1 family hydrophobic/amphiphilic exporter-1